MMRGERALVVLCLCFVSGASAALRVGPASKVTPTISEGQRHADVAAGDGGFLVVWESGVGGASKVRAARVGLDGVSLDPGGFTLGSASGGQFDPAVIWGHGVYLVVWSDMRSGDHAVYGARVSPQGQVLDPAGILLSTEPTAARMADGASIPSGFLVVWAQAESTEHGFVVRARRVGIDGQPNQTTLHLTDALPWSFGEDWGRSVITDLVAQQVRVAIQGTSALVMWGGGPGRAQGYFIVSATIDLDTWAVVGAPRVAVVGAASRIYSPAVCEFGAGYLFSWTDFRERGGLGLPSENAGVMDADGGVLYSSLLDTREARIVWAPAVSPDGTIAFVDPPQLIVREISPAGMSSGMDSLVEPGGAWPALATHPGGSTLLVYTITNAPRDNGMLRARVILH